MLYPTPGLHTTLHDYVLQPVALTRPRPANARPRINNASTSTTQSLSYISKKVALAHLGGTGHQSIQLYEVFTDYSLERQTEEALH